jgi:hypothetical protein
LWFSGRRATRGGLPVDIVETPKGVRVDLGAVYAYRASDLNGHEPDDDRVLLMWPGWDGDGRKFVTDDELIERLTGTIDALALAVSERNAITTPPS